MGRQVTLAVTQFAASEDREANLVSPFGSKSRSMRNTTLLLRYAALAARGVATELSSMLPVCSSVGSSQCP